MGSLDHCPPGDHIFYCYFERVASRRLWLFFVRNYRGEEVLVKCCLQESFLSRWGSSGTAASVWGRRPWTGRIGAGPATSTGSWQLEKRSTRLDLARGGVAPYGLRREEIRNRGMMLAVPDEVGLELEMSSSLLSSMVSSDFPLGQVMKAGKAGTVLFRVWVQVERVEK